MANQDSPESGGIIKALARMLIALVTSTSIRGCGMIAKHVDDIARHVDDIAKHSDDIARHLVRAVDDFLPQLPNTNFEKSANRGVRIIDELDDIANINIEELQNTILVIKNEDEIFIIKKIHQTALKNDDLKKLASGKSYLNIPNKNYYDNLDYGIKSAVQKAAARAAQDAVRQALSEDINHESFQALAELAANNAALQEISKLTGYSAIVISTAQMAAIVNQSTDKALEENISNEVEVE